ncbi:hypothetical protein EIP91_006962 [Steccherinum ochraceum]|uniref:Uncharacterized protein n=1 Tax=Steccherinum ochraceum TaxID=92696 RepID=A0A4R0R4T6_9APHY|nr:hypothetical protein EIP91_006962 [Steccherinum ochraceum]
MSSSLAKDADLEPAEIWDLVRVLSEKLKDTRKLLSSLQEENEQLLVQKNIKEDVEEDAIPDLQCQEDTCPHAIKAKERKQRLKAIKVKMSEKMSARDAEIAELKRRLAEQPDLRGDEGGVEVLTDDDEADALSDDSVEKLDNLEVPSRPMKRARNLDELTGSQLALPNWAELKPCFLQSGSKDPTSSHRGGFSACNSERLLFCGRGLSANSQDPYSACYVTTEYVYNGAKTESQRWAGRPVDVFYVTQPPNVNYGGTYMCTEIVMDAKCDVSEEVRLPSFDFARSLNKKFRYYEAHAKIV